MTTMRSCIPSAFSAFPLRFGTPSWIFGPHLLLFRLISSLVVDGALVIRAVPGAAVTIEKLTVSNRGWEWKVCPTAGMVLTGSHDRLAHESCSSALTVAASHLSRPCVGSGAGRRRGCARGAENPRIQGREARDAGAGVQAPGEVHHI